MEQIKIGKLVMPPVAHIGVVVYDIKKSVEYYSAIFGEEVFRLSKANLTPEINAFGQGSIALSLAHYDMNNLTYEMMQVLDGETAHTDFLRSKGEGIHHLGFKVNNLNEWVLKMENEGYKQILAQKAPLIVDGEARDISFSYIDTAMVGGVVFELVQYG